VWQASTKLAKGYSYLGIQDATRKRRSPTTEPGPWAGTIVRMSEDVRKLVSVERWAKTRARLAEIRKGLTDWQARPDVVKGLDRKMLERARGFLVYFARAYTPLWPYLKGLHLTIDGWRPDCDDGWRDAALREWWQERNEGVQMGDLSGHPCIAPGERPLGPRGPHSDGGASGATGATQAVGGSVLRFRRRLW
jgi:hypothetical protein